jgi:GntR family transcriptional regulator
MEGGEEERRKAPVTAGVSLALICMDKYSVAYLRPWRGGPFVTPSAKTTKAGQNLDETKVELPRYGQVLAELREEIESGVYGIGEDLPTEAQLCARYSVSRFTVREALRRLTEAGLIDRLQGRGSRVIARSPGPSYAMSVENEEGILRYAQETSIEFKLGGRPVSSSTAKELGLGSPDHWVHLSGLRTANAGSIIGLTDAYISSEYRDAVDIGRPISSAIFSRIVRDYGLTLSHIDQEISIATLPSGVARRLHSESGSPAMKIIRRYTAHEVGLFEVSVTVHPADRFRYAVRLERSDLGTINGFGPASEVERAPERSRRRPRS